MLEFFYAITTLITLNSNPPIHHSFTNVKHIYTRLILANQISNPPKLQYSPSLEVNAYYNQANHTITINEGILRISTKANVAWVLGHEMGHAFRQDQESHYAAEYASDRIGYNLVVQAGYNGCAAASLTLKFGDYESSDHPSGPARYKALGCS